MQACEDRIPTLVDASAGELSAQARAELSTHLLQCPGCRAELESLRETTALLSETSNVPDPLHLSGFATRTAERAEAFRDRSARGLWWSITRGVRVAMSLSGAALAASVTLFVAAQRPVVAPTPTSTSDASAPTTTTDSWETYIPEAISVVHENANVKSAYLAAEPLSLDEGLDDLSVDELETLTLSLSQG